MRPSVVDAALRVAASALAAWTIAAVTWAVLVAGVPRGGTTVAAGRGVALSRSEPLARGGRPVGAVGSDAVLRVGAALPPDPLPAQVAAPAETPPATVDTPLGPLAYASTLDVLATYYTPANGGKLPDSRWYGITATGARATRGIVAVDPRVIPMYSWLYVPGYGVAQARDVGSAIIGDHIDVAFDDGDGAWWGRRYLTVYLLVPGTVGR